jgi:uncharacterized alpha-E superfamily protein
LSSLLARFAANIYWLGRYLERAESLARILDSNKTYARDRREGPDWQRILDLYADRKQFRKLYRKADTASVLAYYVLDRDNPASITSTIAFARQNARSVRHLISTEMWTHLNIFHNQIRQLTQRDIWLSNLSTSCTGIKIGCQTFEGIAEGTFFRGEEWCFYQLGKYIERADQTTRILDMGYDLISDEEGDALKSVQWNVLLRSVSGYHAYRSQYPTVSHPQDVAAFLLYDKEFPRAVALCIDQVTRQIRNLENRHGLRARPSVEENRRALEFLLETGLEQRVTPRQLHRFLDRLQSSLGAVSDAMHQTYFVNT